MGVLVGFEVGTLVTGLLLGKSEGDFDGFEVGTLVTGLLLGESDGPFEGFDGSVVGSVVVVAEGAGVTGDFVGVVVDAAYRQVLSLSCGSGVMYMQELLFSMLHAHPP